MNCRKIFIGHLILTAAIFGQTMQAQDHPPPPAVNIDPSRHGNLSAAQSDIVDAYLRIHEAQGDNGDHLGGHAQRAKDFLAQADAELQQAAAFADQNQQGGPPPAASVPPPAAPQSPPDLTGKWTIYAYNVNRPGSSLKTIQVVQRGNIISGTFHGPNQHGKMQGLITGNHVEFSTDTRDILTFRGEITPTGMSGLYGVNGQHAPWTAERTN